MDWYSLEPQTLENAEIEFTSRCNLRCTYCAVSRPGYVNRDLPQPLFAGIFQELSEIGAQMVQINGHGETTFLKDWVSAAEPFVANFPCKLISNFACPFEEREIALLARLKLIHISIDSTNEDVLRNIRRKVSLDTIVDNIKALQSYTAGHNIVGPELAFISGIYDKNVFDLPGLARLAVHLDIKEVFFWALWKHGDIEGAVNVNALDNLPTQEQERALASIEATLEILRRGGIRYEIPGDFVKVFGAGVAARRGSA